MTFLEIFLIYLLISICIIYFFKVSKLENKLKKFEKPKRKIGFKI